MVKRIFAWATDGAGCYFYRLQLPLLHLPADRFSISIGAPGPDIHGYDIVIGQRIAPPSPLWEELCADPNVLTVYDIDDDLMNIDPANAVPPIMTIIGTRAAAQNPDHPASIAG